ncbi:hypothetical protein Moror_7044 [Moniliophthora roreri MCA 2997]|uniref:F-box domain-containing protein n=2 Tax=Moniliophthora roreri TaxID=221103 RepID=V2XUK1_MONRO|nr:hypothetical protein Moror_7044 [Moniliophthora roreri MCA 2997]KAI3619782.1 hypothetical protein WG66_002838 [Moniliophthora roreri]
MSLNNVTRRLQLPQEIIDNIVDVHKGSIRDLKSCSLIGRAWLSRSRKHLFQSLRLKGNYNPNVIGEAIGILGSVLPLVHDLSIIDSSESSKLQLTYVMLISIGQSFSKLDRLALKGVTVDETEKGSDADIALTTPSSLSNLTLVGVTFLDSRAMHRFLHNPLFSRIRFISVDAISFTGNDRPSFQQSAKRTKLEEFNLGNVRSAVLRALWSPSSPLDFYTNMKRISIFTNTPGDSADVSLENAEMWGSVTHLSFSGWRSNTTLFPPHLTHLTMTYKYLTRQGPDSRLSHLATTSPKIQYLVLVFYWPHRTDSDKLNSIMSDFDEDLATVSKSFPDLIEIRVRFVLKSEHSGGFGLTERLKAMFLKADEAILLKKEQDPECGTLLAIEVREIGDAEYRGDLRIGFGFEY